jgi:hypothetical protein
MTSRPSEDELMIERELDLSDEAMITRAFERRSSRRSAEREMTDPDRIDRLSKYIRSNNHPLHHASPYVIAAALEACGLRLARA